MSLRRRLARAEQTADLRAFIRGSLAALEEDNPEWAAAAREALRRERPRDKVGAACVTLAALPPAVREELLRALAEGLEDGTHDEAA